MLADHGQDNPLAALAGLCPAMAPFAIFFPCRQTGSITLTTTRYWLQPAIPPLGLAASRLRVSSHCSTHRSPSRPRSSRASMQQQRSPWLRLGQLHPRRRWLVNQAPSRRSRSTSTSRFLPARTLAERRRLRPCACWRVTWSSEPRGGGHRRNHRLSLGPARRSPPSRRRSTPTSSPRSMTATRSSGRADPTACSVSAVARRRGSPQRYYAEAAPPTTRRNLAQISPLRITLDSA